MQSRAQNMGRLDGLFSVMTDRLGCRFISGLFCKP
jgi:hypothetical protein